MAATVQFPQVFWEEKVFIEPDLGDQRQSTYKALPSPPKTPKRVLMKYWFSGMFPLALSFATCVLSVAVAFAEQNEGMFRGQYLVALNTSQLRQDVMTFDEGSASFKAPSVPAVASATASPLEVLAPSSTNSSLHSANRDKPIRVVGESLGKTASNLTQIVDQAGIKDFYYVFVQRVCSGSVVNGDGSDAGSIRIDDCRSYEEASHGIRAFGRSVYPAMIMGEAQVSLPLHGEVASSLESVIDNVTAVRKSIFAFLITTMVGSAFSAVSSLLAMYFPQSRLLVYVELLWTGLATVCALLAAMLISILEVIAIVLDRLSEAVGVQIGVGGTALLLVWLGFVLVSLTTFYWACVWFVETRTSSFVKRQRDEDEMGHWRGIGGEVWRDLRGQRRKGSMQM